MCPTLVKDITILNKNHGHRHCFIVTDDFWSESVVETALTFDDGGNHKKNHTLLLIDIPEPRRLGSRIVFAMQAIKRLSIIHCSKEKGIILN